MKLIYFVFFSIFFSIQVAAQSSKIINLVAPEFPPYTYLEDNEATGIGVKLIKQLLKNSPYQYTITIVKDYGLAVFLLKKGKADALFLASQNNERDAIAIFSKPLLMNRWSWYFNPDAKLNPNSTSFKRDAGVGTILHTNTHKWLKKNRYHVIGQPTSPLALNKMLANHRIDAAFVAEAVFENAIPYDQHTQYQKIIAVEKPFGIYVSNKLNQQQPDFLQYINEQIALNQTNNQAIKKQ